MALQMEELATQVLAQTRVVTNGPVLGQNEPLRVDVIPGGTDLTQVGITTISGVVGSATSTLSDVSPVQVAVAYKVLSKDQSGNWVPLTTGVQVIPTPSKAKRVEPDASGAPQSTDLAGISDQMLSFALLLAPKLKFGGRKSDVPLPAVMLPELDRKLVVTVTVTTRLLNNVSLTRDVEVPFTVPTLQVPLRVPALCLCANDKDFSGSKLLVLAAPGSPQSVAELVATYNNVIELLEALKSLVSLLSVVIAPIKKLADLLAKVPLAEVAVDREVPDWDKYNDFDDEMRSFFLLAPTGYGIRFSDTANPGDWDDTGDNSYKRYMAVDLLKLPDEPKTQLRDHIAAHLGVSVSDIKNLRTQLSALTGVNEDKLEIGIGVYAVADLGDESLGKEVINYDKSSSSDDDERLWEKTTIGSDGDIESSIWILP